MYILKQNEKPSQITTYQIIAKGKTDMRNVNKTVFINTEGCADETYYKAYNDELNQGKVCKICKNGGRKTLKKRVRKNKKSNKSKKSKRTTKKH